MSDIFDNGFQYTGFHEGYHTILGEFVPHKSFAWIFSGLNEPFRTIAKTHEAFSHPRVFSQDESWFQTIVYADLFYAYLEGNEGVFADCLNNSRPLIEALALLEIHDSYPDSYQAALKGEEKRVVRLTNIMAELNSTAKRLLVRFNQENLSTAFSIPKIMSGVLLYSNAKKASYEEGLIFILAWYMRFLNDEKTTFDDVEKFRRSEVDWFQMNVAEPLSLCMILDMLQLLCEGNPIRIPEETILLNLLFCATGEHKRFSFRPSMEVGEEAFFTNHYNGCYVFYPPPNTIVFRDNLPRIEWEGGCGVLPMLFSGYLVETTDRILYARARSFISPNSEPWPKAQDQVAADVALGIAAIDSILDNVQTLSNQWKAFSNGFREYTAFSKEFYEKIFNNLQGYIDPKEGGNPIVMPRKEAAKRAIGLLSDFDRESARQKIMRLLPDALAGTSSRVDLQQRTHAALRGLRDSSHVITGSETVSLDILGKFFTEPQQYLEALKNFE